MRLIADIPVRHIFEDIHKIIERILPVLFCGSNQAELDGTGLLTARGIGKKEVFAVYDKGLYAPFGSVVADFKPSVEQIAQQISTCQGAMAIGHIGPFSSWRASHTAAASRPTLIILAQVFLRRVKRISILHGGVLWGLGNLPQQAVFAKLTAGKLKQKKQGVYHLALLAG